MNKLIESILCQTYQIFELITFDGMSNDGITGDLNKYRNNKDIKMMIEADKGLCHARNKGLLLDLGDIISSLNINDFYCKEYEK